MVLKHLDVIGKKILRNRARQSILRLDTKNMIHKKKTDKLKLIKIKYSYSVKDPFKRMKSYRVGENICRSHIWPWHII